MIRIKEHYSTIVREELALLGATNSTYDRPKLSGLSMHTSLKPFNFNPYSVGPRIRAQELTFGSRSTMSFSSLSEQTLGIRKGALVGIRASKHNASFVYESRDRVFWGLAGLGSHLFVGWMFKSMSGSIGLRSVVPMHEYHQRPKKDMAFRGLNKTYRDWSFHFSRGIVPTLSVYLVQGMGVPLKTKPEKPPRMQRSKTVRKYMKKIHKQRMKKKPT